MIIKIIAVGKIKDRYFKDAIQEYEKRLAPFCSLSIIEIPAEQIFDEALRDKYKDIEANKILSLIKSDSFIITLEINGKLFSSEQFARKIKHLSNEGYHDITFIVGGANGLSEKISEISNLKLSFSPLTFTHQMIRPMLLEQLYRTFKILSNEPYHR